MEQAITIALQKFFTAKTTDKKGPNPRGDFYAKYKQEAEHADKDFQKKYEEDLNTTLIFVCSFTSARFYSTHVLGTIGRSFLSSDFWFHHQHPE